MVLDKKQQKIIIFDWDDTICPSSFVDRCNIENVSELPEHLFAEIATTAEKCLYEASRHAQVIVITNSDDGWVQYSCEKYLPQLLPVMEKYSVVSARTGYEKFYPNQPLCWKAAAFAHEVNEAFDSLDETTSLESTDVSSDDSSADFSSASGKPSAGANRQIISFGDSIEERTAVRIVSEQLGATSKSVMFVQSPNPAQIVGQLILLTQHMQYVCDHASSLDLEMCANQADQCAATHLRRKKIHVEDRQLGAHMNKMHIQRSNSKESDTVTDGVHAACT